MSRYISSTYEFSPAPTPTWHQSSIAVTNVDKVWARKLVADFSVEERSILCLTSTHRWQRHLPTACRLMPASPARSWPVQMLSRREKGAYWTKMLNQPRDPRIQLISLQAPQVRARAETEQNVCKADASGVGDVSKVGHDGSLHQGGPECFGRSTGKSRRKYWLGSSRRPEASGDRYQAEVCRPLGCSGGRGIGSSPWDLGSIISELDIASHQDLASDQRCGLLAS